MVIVGAALGAARLALTASSGAAPQDVMTAPQLRETVDPDPALTAQFAEAYGRFKASYPGVKAIQ